MSAHARNGADHKITAIVLNDGTPIKTLEVKVDDGPWVAATADPATQFIETEVTRLNLKSVIARVRKSAGGGHQVLGFVLNDGTPLKSVEVKVDEGPWQRATLDPANSTYSWKLFTWQWQGAAPGDHTIVSRATDANGVVQPTTAELSRKKTFLEDNSQFPRKVRIG